MERVFTFYNEDHAMRFCWEVLKLGEKAKIDAVEVDRESDLMEINVRFWTEETEALLEEISQDAKPFRSSFKFATQEMNAKDAVILMALGKGSILKSKLVDDVDGTDCVNALIYTIVEATASAAPGPSSKVYNFAMDQLEIKEKIGEYV